MFPHVVELGLVGVADPGVPNRERIVLRPMEMVDLSAFGVLVGVRLPNESVMPIWDNFFWFGHVTAVVPSWILLFTGPGEFRQSPTEGKNEMVYEFHWNRPQTIFAADKIVPVVFQIGAISIGRNEAAPHKVPPPPTALPSPTDLAAPHSPTSATAKALADLLKKPT